MPKLLGEFLQEQQEPFVLEFYLLERGYRAKKNVRFLKIKRRDAIPSCAKFVSAVFKRAVLHNSREIKNKPRNGSGEIIEANDEDEDEFTSASATTFYSSCSENEVEEDAECITKQSDSSHEAKQLSPISVLEETDSEEASPLHQRKYNFKKTKGESSKSISQRKSRHQANKSVPKFEECMDYYDHQYSINKRALQQKRLLVDCVREVIENERKRDDERGKQLKRILGAEELWKVVCENVWLWSQESIHEKNIHHLVKCDFMASLQELNSASHQERDEVSMEIGDAILEDIINEIIAN